MIIKYIFFCFLFFDIDLYKLSIFLKKLDSTVWKWFLISKDKYEKYVKVTKASLSQSFA